MPKNRKSAPLVPNSVSDLDSVNEGLGRLYTGRGGQPGSGILHGPEATTAVSLFPSVMRILSCVSLLTGLLGRVLALSREELPLHLQLALRPWLRHQTLRVLGEPCLTEALRDRRFGARVISLTTRDKARCATRCRLALRLAHRLAGIILVVVAAVNHRHRIRNQSSGGRPHGTKPIGAPTTFFSSTGHLWIELG